MRSEFAMTLRRVGCQTPDQKPRCKSVKKDRESNRQSSFCKSECGRNNPNVCKVALQMCVRPTDLQQVHRGQRCHNRATQPHIIPSLKCYSAPACKKGSFILLIMIRVLDARRISLLDSLQCQSRYQRRSYSRPILRRTDFDQIFLIRLPV